MQYIRDYLSVIYPNPILILASMTRKLDVQV